MGVHIQADCNQINVSGPFSVTKQRTLYPIGSGKQPQFRIGNRTAAIVMRMQRNLHTVTIFQIFRHKFNLIGVNMRQRKFYRNRQIDHRFSVRRRLPDIQHLVADFQRILRLRTRKRLGRILKPIVTAIIADIFIQQFSTLCCNPLNLIFGFAKNLLALRQRRRVVQMYNGVRNAFQTLKRFADNMFPGLR